MSKYNKKTVLLLCIFLGYLGGHHFYVKRGKMGLLYLCTIGLLGIGWIVDIILICTNKFKDDNGEYITTPSISNKARNGAIIGVAAVYGITICSSISSSKPNDSEIIENIDTTTSIAETTIDTYDDYIDVNSELNKITETTTETTTSLTSITEETTETTTSDDLFETQTTVSEYAELSNDSNNLNNSEIHFTDYDIPEQQNTIEYVLNTSTHKFHKPTCSSVKKIKPENYSTTDSRESAINNGYEPCGICHP